MLVPNFCGGFYQALSPVIAADQAVNVYTETREVPGSAKQVTMYGTPGLTNFLTAATNGSRGLFSQAGRTFWVVGTNLYEVNVNAEILTLLGTIANDDNPVSFATNGAGGEQLAIVGGGELKVFNLVTNTLSAAITLPFANPVMIVFMDGYGLINEANTPKVWYSALEDFTSWNALDFFARSGTSDNLVALAVTRDRLWCFGEKTTTQFYNSGDADNPFLPYPGTTIQIGIVTPWCLQVYQDVCYWAGQSATGQVRIWHSAGSEASAISTPPIDLWLGGLGTGDPIECLFYEQGGHPFAIWTCPAHEDPIKTYAYDVRESLWHARAGWDTTTGQYTRWRARASVAVNSFVIVGDYDDNRLYTLSLQAYSDDDDPIRRERTAPYISAEAEWMFINQVWLGVQAGGGLADGQGSDPVVSLEISRDGAQTWVSAGLATLGRQGQYLARAIWRRLGRVRADLLVLRVTQTDPVPCVWGPGLWIKATNGTGNL